MEARPNTAGTATMTTWRGDTAGAGAGGGGGGGESQQSLR